MTEADLSNSVIVIESPNKADKYRKYTGATVIATVGHFKDIPKASFGINLKTYYPTFRILPGRSAVMERLKKSKGKSHAHDDLPHVWTVYMEDWSGL